MTDKEKIRAEIEAVKLIIQANRAQGAFSEGYLLGQESVVEHLEKFVDSMQEEPVSDTQSPVIFYGLTGIVGYTKEEPVSRTPADIEAAMQEVEEKSKAFTEALICDETKYLPWQNVKEEVLPTLRGEELVSEDLEEASKEWLKPQLDKSYSSYGEDKMMELTRFDGYAMLDAIEFGANWQRSQLMRSAIEVVISDDTTICNAVELMKLQEKYKGQKVKIAIIKED